MKRKIYLKILLGISIFILLIKLLTIILVAPWVGKKIQIFLNEKNRDYLVKIEKVHIFIIKSGLVLENITLSSNQEHGNHRNLTGEIASIKLKGFKMAKAIFKKDIDINNVTISNSIITGNIPFSQKKGPPMVFPMNLRIGWILFDKINLSLGNDSTKQTFLLKEGFLKVYDLQIEKQNTLSPGIVKQFDFEAKRLVSVSPDSMYLYTANGFFYTGTSNTLSVDSLSVKPNFRDYEFTSMHEFQTARIEAGFSNIYFHGFDAAEYFRSGSLKSSYIKIRKMDMKVFRDKRKEFRHADQPPFQDMIYNYPGTVRIDSIGLTSGNVTYTVHAEQANEAGSISFNDINAKIYNITNDTIYKTENISLELKADALLMGKGKMTILLNSRTFDRNNTFSLNGTLSGLAADELNPILEKNAFIYATSGIIDEMKFSLTANNTKAAGKMILLYHGLDIAVKNKRTDDTTALKERFFSSITNRKILNSNPVPGEKVREGTIDYERDPERFLFNYCFKSILSGIKSSLIRSPKKK